MKTRPDGFATPVLQRALWTCVASCGAFVLAVAAVLEPDPLGYGTHTQLGLPPCGFRSLTGMPCPGCGLTTAFAHAVRGDWPSALDANPLGVVLFIIVCVSIPLGIVGASRNWSLDATVERFALGRWGLAVAACAGALWVARWTAAL